MRFKKLSQVTWQSWKFLFINLIHKPLPSRVVNLPRLYIPSVLDSTDTQCTNTHCVQVHSVQICSAYKYTVCTSTQCTSTQCIQIHSAYKYTVYKYAVHTSMQCTNTCHTCTLMVFVLMIPGLKLKTYMLELF
jgi:hypothetical protein